MIGRRMFRTTSNAGRMLSAAQLVLFWVLGVWATTDLVAVDLPKETQSLFEAAMTGDEETLNALLTAGLDPDTRGERDLTPLISAAGAGQLYSVQILIEAGAALEATNADGQTALMYASQNGHRTVVDFLLDRGAKTYTIAKDGATALFFAAAFNQHQIVESLVAAGAEVNTKTVFGQTPLMGAASVGSLESVTILLKNGADFAIFDQYLHDAFIYALSNRHIEIARIFLTLGLDPNRLDTGGLTPLMSAVINDNGPAAIFLLDEAGAEPDVRHPQELTALMFASALGRLGAIDLLLSSGADIEARAVDGQTPLMAAAQQGQKGAIRVLLEAGADIAARNNRGFTALSIAFAYDRNEIVEELRKHQAGRGTAAMESTYLPYDLERDEVGAVSVLLSGTDQSPVRLSFSLGEGPEPRKKIIYNRLPAAVLETEIGGFLEICGQGSQALAEHQGETLVIFGPRITTVLNRGGHLEGENTNTMLINLQTKVPGVLMSCAFRGESVPKAAKVIHSLLFAGGPLTIRNIDNVELDWYWASIGWDVEDPLFVVENDRYSLLIDLNEDGTVWYVDQISGLEWEPFFLDD